MHPPLPFALQATQACVPHAELALSLAAAFHDVDAGLVDERIERLVDRVALPGHGAPEPADELEALARLLADPGMPAATIGSDVCCLMLDDALAHGPAHPLMRAVIAVEVGRRCGMEVGLVSNGDDHFIGHERLDEPSLLKADSGEVVGAEGLPGVLRWQCSHEACGLLLDELEQRWLLWTRFDQALLAGELRLRLPLDGESTQAARLRLDRTRARLN